MEDQFRFREETSEIIKGRKLSTIIIATVFVVAIIADMIDLYRGGNIKLFMVISRQGITIL